MFTLLLTSAGTLTLCMDQFLRLPSPSRAIPPGFVFFLQECSKFPTPGTLKLDNSPPQGITKKLNRSLKYVSKVFVLQNVHCTVEKKINYLPSKIGFNFYKLFFPHHSPTNSQDFPEKASCMHKETV